MCFLNLGVKGLTMAPHTFTVKSLRCRHIGSTKWGGVGWGGVGWGGVGWGGSLQETPRALQVQGVHSPFFVP